MKQENPERERRSRLKTEHKLINSVGEIIKKYGYTKLNIQNIAKEAGVDRKLVYAYFGNLDNLVEEYFKTKDYWTAMSAEVKKLLEKNEKQNNVNLSYEIIKNQYYFFKDNIEMQNMILWEISESKPFLKDIADHKENVTNDLFKYSAHVFDNSGISIRSVNAILVTAVYYLIIHARNNGSTICGIDINSKEGEEDLLKTIEQILKWAYTNALHATENK